MNDSGKRENLSNIDTAWWRMEHPTNLMMVTGFMSFEKPVSYQALRRLIEKRLLTFKRFRQIVEDPKPNLKSPTWRLDPNFDLNHHLIRENLPEPGDYEALKKRTETLMSEPLDYSRPLWQIHLLEGFKTGNAIIVRTHHCIADGMALIAVMFTMTGATARDSLQEEMPPEMEPRSLNSSGNIFKVAGRAISKTGKAIGNLVSSTKIIDLAVLGGQSAMTTVRLLLKKPDPPTRFKGPLQVQKAAAWSRPIPLERVKAIKNTVDATVNDVLLTAMTGGLRRYLEAKGDSTEGLNFRAFVPVNLRPPSQARDLGNYFGLVFLTLPVGIVEPMARLQKLKTRMDRIKNSPEAIVAIGILKAVGMTPAEIQKSIVNVFGAKSTAVMTNVPGPREHLYLAGSKVSSMMFWVPQSGRVGLGVSILSYAGEVRLGVATDRALVPDPDLIIEGFQKELEDMTQLVQPATPHKPDA